MEAREAFWVLRFWVTIATFKRFYPDHKRLEFWTQDVDPVLEGEGSPLSEFLTRLAELSELPIRGSLDCEWEYAYRALGASSFRVSDDLTRGVDVPFRSGPYPAPLVIVGFRQAFTLQTDAERAALEKL